MTFERITAPSFEPITVAEAKAHCRETSSAWDAVFPTIIGAARERAEIELGRGLMLQTWECSVDGFEEAVRLWPTKVLAIVSVTYIDTEGNAQVLAADQYALDNESVPGWIKPAYGLTWPATRDVMNAVTVRYRVGYVDDAAEATQRSAVPFAIKQWMLVQIATLYENREQLITGTSVSDLPGRVVDGLLDRERTYAI